MGCLTSAPPLAHLARRRSAPRPRRGSEGRSSDHLGLAAIAPAKAVKSGEHLSFAASSAPKSWRSSQRMSPPAETTRDSESAGVRRLLQASRRRRGGGSTSSPPRCGAYGRCCARLPTRGCGAASGRRRRPICARRWPRGGLRASPDLLQELRSSLSRREACGPSAKATEGLARSVDVLRLFRPRRSSACGLRDAPHGAIPVRAALQAASGS